MYPEYGFIVLLAATLGDGESRGIHPGGASDAIPLRAGRWCGGAVVLTVCGSRHLDDIGEPPSRRRRSGRRCGHAREEKSCDQMLSMRVMLTVHASMRFPVPVPVLAPKHSHAPTRNFAGRG